MPTLPWTTPNEPRPGVTTVVVMASRLEVRSLKHVPRFFRQSLTSWKQMRVSQGALGGSLIAEPLRRTFWTLSAWEGREQLYAYARAEPHHTIVKGLRSVMRRSSFVFWEVPVEELPISWSEAKRRIAEQQALEARS